MPPPPGRRESAGAVMLNGVKSLADLEQGFPDEFFSEVVYSETKRALDAVDDPAKVIAWVSTGYILASVIIIPLTGWLGEFFGRKRYFVGSILVFTAASFFCVSGCEA